MRRSPHWWARTFLGLGTHALFLSMQSWFLDWEWSKWPWRVSGWQLIPREMGRSLIPWSTPKRSDLQLTSKTSGRLFARCKSLSAVNTITMLEKQSHPDLSHYCTLYSSGAWATFWPMTALDMILHSSLLCAISNHSSGFPPLMHISSSNLFLVGQQVFSL